MRKTRVSFRNVIVCTVVITWWCELSCRTEHAVVDGLVTVRCENVLRIFQLNKSMCAKIVCVHKHLIKMYGLIVKTFLINV